MPRYLGQVGEGRRERPGPGRAYEAAQRSLAGSARPSSLLSVLALFSASSPLLSSAPCDSLPASCCSWGSPRRYERPAPQVSLETGLGREAEGCGRHYVAGGSELVERGSLREKGALRPPLFYF